MVLAPQADDLAHPAFGKLFVESEYVPESAALLCHRRLRAPDDAAAWGVHVISQEGRTQGPVEWESDSACFLGRGRSPRDPQALDGRSLTGTTGVLLDPIASLRQRIRLAPGGVARMAFATGMSSSRETALALAQRYRDPSATARTFALASAHARSTLRYLGIASSEEALLFERRASRVLRGDGSLRADPELLARNTLGQEGLRPHGISGDVPILLVRVAGEDGLALVRQALQAQELCRRGPRRRRRRLLLVDPVGYLDEAGTVALTALLDDGPWRAWKHRPGGAYLLRFDRMPEAERLLLSTVARAILSDDRGGLAQQLDRPAPSWTDSATPSLPRPLRTAPRVTPIEPVPVPGLTLANGLGGFAGGGREYVIVLEGAEETPSPWVNVIANPISGRSSRPRARPTPGPGTAARTGSPLSPTTPSAIRPRKPSLFGTTRRARPGRPRQVPCPGRPTAGRYVIRHAAGVTRFAHAAAGIRQELAVFVDDVDPVKLSLLTLTNAGETVRNLSLYAYNEWVLGPPQEGQHLHAVTRRTRRPARSSRRIPGTTTPRRGWPLPMRASRRARPPGTAPPSSVATGRWPRRPRFARRRSRIASGPVSTRARGSRFRSRWRPERPGGLSSCWAKEPTWATCGSSWSGMGTSRPLWPRSSASAGGHDPRRGPGTDPRRLLRPPDEPVAPLPGPGLPGLGPLRLSPARRCLRLPGPAPGRDGSGARPPGPHPRAPPPGRFAAVRGGRRPALVA